VMSIRKRCKNLLENSLNPSTLSLLQYFGTAEGSCLKAF
jgi:hypothetical protein